MTLPRDRFLETAARIGARICRDAIWAGDRCNWLGDSMEKLDGAWKVAHRALTPDLYGGTSGIALFLNRLHAFTGEEILRETAEGAIRQACSRIPYFSPVVKPSLYLGVTGVAYALSAMGCEDQARRALDDVNRVDPSNVADHFGLDVIGGIAGAIPPLLSLGVSLSAPACIDRAFAFGEDLLHCARKSDSGWSWNTLHVADHRASRISQASLMAPPASPGPSLSFTRISRTLVSATPPRKRAATRTLISILNRRIGRISDICTTPIHQRRVRLIPFRGATALLVLDSTVCGHIRSLANHH